MDDSVTIERAFQSARRRLWSLGYRMTGVAADADEVVQDAFVRALETWPVRSRSGGCLAAQPAEAHGGNDRDAGHDGREEIDEAEQADLERWLVRVVTNLSLDLLRRRKRRPYPGPWLPAPVESTAAPIRAPLHAGGGREPGSVDAVPDVAERIESADEISYAYLVALESLPPRARAALLLTDVLEYSAAEVASILGTSEGNVRVLHHRARRTIDALDVTAFPTEAARTRQREALERFVACMLQQDAAGMEALLVEDVRSITDGGGRYTALREPLCGRDSVIRFHLETARRRAPISRSEIRSINGDAALVVVTRPIRRQMAPRLVLSCRVGADGRIRELTTVLAPQKLTAVSFGDARPGAGVPAPRRRFVRAQPGT